MHYSALESTASRMSAMARVTSVRLSEQLAIRLEELAGALDRPRSWVIEQAIARYVGEQAWQVTAISSALDEYQAGATQPHNPLPTIRSCKNCSSRSTRAWAMQIRWLEPARVDLRVRVLHGAREWPEMD
jgi:predicted transcriptional regulator